MDPENIKKGIFSVPASCFLRFPLFEKTLFPFFRFSKKRKIGIPFAGKHTFRGRALSAKFEIRSF